MGKSEEEQARSTLPSSSGAAERNADGARCRHCRWIGRIFRPRCAVAVVLGVAVLLSALFWIPPFLRGQADRGDVDPDMRFGANILASFKLQRSVSELESSITKLQYDIFEEIGVANSSVTIISMDPLTGSNSTNVVFGVLPYPANAVISSAGLSILRSYLVSFVIGQSTLHLTPSLFGNPSFFQVLEFPGGITIIPQQNVFLLQHVQTLFNFTLNFSIYQVQAKIDELKNQMRTGLHLTSNENLYVSLTNMIGSTLAPPTIVQTAILPEVGVPSKSRLKELAKAIAGSPARNLGLNHTVFGRVKQIRLSSYLQHSLNGSNSGTVGSPSPAPQQHPSLHHPHPHHHPHHPHHRHRHRHSHHHHHLHHHRYQNPVTDLAPAPAPPRRYRASSPSGCQLGFSPKFKRKSHIAPAALPPVLQKNPSHFPTEPPSASSSHIGSSPLPAVSFAHIQPPSKGVTSAKPPDQMLPSSCCVPGFASTRWALAPVLYLLLLHL